MNKSFWWNQVLQNVFIFLMFFMIVSHVLVFNDAVPDVEWLEVIIFVYLFIAQSFLFWLYSDVGLNVGQLDLFIVPNLLGWISLILINVLFAFIIAKLFSVIWYKIKKT